MMQAPLHLPDHLIPYTFYSSDQELFQFLILKLDDLLLFFKFGCEDEKWFLLHSKFIRLVLRWAAKQFYLENLSIYYARHLVNIIQKHYSLLEPFLFFRSALFFTVKLRVEDQEIVVNSFLFGVCSPPLARLFKRECFEKLNNEWRFSSIRLPIFRLIESYFLKGEIPDLSKYGYEDLLLLMEQAKTWELHELIKGVVSYLRRYIHSNHVIEILLNAHQKVLKEWKEEIYHFFNQQNWGINLIPGKEEDLKVKFLDFQIETLELFELFAPWITHLAFGNLLSENLNFQTLIERCPNLIGIDLSESLFDVNLSEILPPYLLELNLSACVWLRSDHLRKIAEHCPYLKKLEVANNTQLNDQAWRELQRFQQLRELNLARCFQLTPEDLKIIGKGCSLLSDLNIEECRQIEDEGIATLAAYCLYLQELNISYCDQLSDRSMKEIGVHFAQLQVLKMVKCRGVTDHGLLQLVQAKPTLSDLDIRDCLFSFKVLEEIRKAYPLLKEDLDGK